MISSRTRHFFMAIGILGALSAMSWMVGCNVKQSSTTTSGGTVTTSMSDPPVCKNSTSPMGPFSNVWVTVTKVTANINGDAGSSDSGWVTLLDLSSSPKQIDLFSTVSTTCVLTQLGSTSGLPPGDYQQIRLYLLADGGSPAPSPNQCAAGNFLSSGTFFNCVVEGGGASELQLSSEAQSGLKIPSGQIAGGKFTIAAGQATDLDISFDACASIVAEGNGRFRLKPVLHAGEVSANNNAIGGTVVDSTGAGIPGATVLLEQPVGVTGIADLVDQVQYSATTDSTGNFFFCPVQGTPGTTTYDVVIAAQIFGGPTYNPDIVFKVPVGTALGNLKMVSEGAGSSGGILAGQVTSKDGAGVVADVTLSPLVAATPTGGSETLVTIPWLSTNTTQAAAQPQNFMTQATANVVTPAAACPAGTDCYNFQIVLPASAAQVGTFSGGSANLPPPPASPTLTISYSLLAATSTCTTSSPSPAVVNGPAPSLVVTPGTTTPVATALAFTGCT